MSGEERTGFDFGPCTHSGKRQSRFWPWLVACLIAALPVCPAQASTLVLPIQATNLERGEEDAIWQLVISAYQAEGNATLIAPSVAEAALAEAGTASAAAARLRAADYLQVSAVRLRQRIVITGTLFAADGTLLHTAKMTASSLDDVEPASERLAKALVRHTDTKATRDLDTITETEGKNPNRTWVRRGGGFKAAFTYPLGYGHEIAPMLSAGFHARFEGARHFMELGVGFTIPEALDAYDLAYGGLYGEFGANWYLGQADTSFYLGAGLMPRLASAALANIAPYGQAGVMFFRESRNHLHADLRIAQNVLPVGFSKGGDYDATTGATTEERQQRLYPTEFSFSVGIGF